MRAIAVLLLTVLVGIGCSKTDPAAPATAASPAASPAPAEVPAAAAIPTATPAPGAAAPTTPAPAAVPARPSAPTLSVAPAASTPPATSSVPSVSAAPAVPPPPAFREITVPAGTRLAIELRSSHASNTSRIEEPVQGVLRRALVVNGDEVVPAGAELGGAVTDAEGSARVKGRARLTLRFTSITIDESSERIVTDPIARVAAGTKKEDAAKIGIGAGAGAVIGAIAGGRKGAVVGGTVGAGAGTGVVLATRGNEVALARGTAVTTTLTQPLVLQVPVR